MIKKILILFVVVVCANKVYSQYKYGTTGLLQMPTAEMQEEGTFMFGGGLLSPEVIPSKEWWGNYYTFNYYLNITIFPWLEIGYNCVLVKGKEGIYHWPEETWGKFVNQDRSFHGRLRLWKEGWWKDWTPQIVIGLNDPTTGSWQGGSSSNDQKYNGFFCRYYVALTKHLDFKGIGTLGLHTAYIYNERKDYPLNGLGIGVNFHFKFCEDILWRRILNDFNLMAEYDVRTINIGLTYSVWKNRINIITELNDCKYFSGGVCFKVPLK